MVDRARVHVRQQRFILHRNTQPETWNEFDAAKRQAQLVASDLVREAIEVYEDWFVGFLIRLSDRSEGGGWEAAEKTLMDKMSSDLNPGP